MKQLPAVKLRVLCFVPAQLISVDQAFRYERHGVLPVVQVNLTIQEIKKLFKIDEQ